MWDFLALVCFKKQSAKRIFILFSFKDKTRYRTLFHIQLPLATQASWRAWISAIIRLRTWKPSNWRIIWTWNGHLWRGIHTAGHIINHLFLFYFFLQDKQIKFSDVLFEILKRLDLRDLKFESCMFLYDICKFIDHAGLTSRMILNSVFNPIANTIFINPQQCLVVFT